MPLCSAERIREQVTVDAVIAALFGLQSNDFAHILRDCDHSEPHGEATGFWRVNKKKSPELRHTVLTQIAFQDLEDKIIAAGDRDQGIEAFLTQNHGEGWMPPGNSAPCRLRPRSRRPRPAVPSRRQPPRPPLLRLATRPNHRRILARMPPPRPQPPRCRRLCPPPLRYRRGA